MYVGTLLILQGVSRKLHLNNHTFFRPIFGIQACYWAHFKEEGVQFFLWKSKLLKDIRDTIQ